MPQAPRAPSLRPPAPPRPPSLGRLRLSPIRSQGSTELDTATTRGGQPLPPFVRFDRFMAEFAPTFKQGDHITTIGPTGSGKTVLNRELLRLRDYVVVLGVKNRDPELYGPFEREGYVEVRRFDPTPPDDGYPYKVLLVPKTSKHGTEGRQFKTRVFRQALNDVYDAGRWCVYADDIQYMSDQLRLAPEFEELWMLGRSEEVSLIASSQEPVDIPLQAYGMASHLFLFRNNDLRRAQRMGELAGANREIVATTILALPDHEFLYIHKSSGRMVRSKVIR